MTPRGGAREALLGGDPPLVVREESTGQAPRFRFTQPIDPEKHGGLIAAACTEWFASARTEDIEEGLVFLDAFIDQAGHAAWTRQLLTQLGPHLLQLAPPPWPRDRLPSIASAIQALGHQLTPQTPAALRRLVLAFHPGAKLAAELRTIDDAVEALEKTGLPWSEDDALQQVKTLLRLSQEARALKSETLVRTAVDLAQRVANGCAPHGQSSPPRVQALVNQMTQGLSCGLTDPVHAWFQTGRAQEAIAWLAQILSTTDELDVCRQQLAAHASSLADSPLSAWADDNGDAVLDAIRALGADGWFLQDKPSHLPPAERLALLQLLARVDPLAAMGLIASELGHRVEQDQPLTPDEGGHQVELLRLLLRLGQEQKDPAVLKRALTWTQALAKACGPRPTGATAALQARLHLLGRDIHEALSLLHIDRLSGWLRLRLEGGSGKSPRTLSCQTIQSDSGVFQRPADPQSAFLALIDFIDAQLAHPQGLSWKQLETLAHTAADALKQPIDPSLWWSWAVAEAQRTGDPRELQERLQHGAPLVSPDDPRFQDLLTVCGNPQLNDEQRATLLRTACGQMLPPPLSVEPRDWLGDRPDAPLDAQSVEGFVAQWHALAYPDESHQNEAVVRATLMRWLQAQARRRVNGLSLPAIRSLAQAMGWPLDAEEWLALCLSDARHRGQPQALIDWLKAPPPRAQYLVDKELFQDILKLARDAPLSPQDRQRLLGAAQTLLNERLPDASLQRHCADAIGSLPGPRKASDRYAKAYQALFGGEAPLLTPPGDALPAAFQWHGPAPSPTAVEALLTVCDSWAGTLKMQAVRALLDAVLGGTQDLELHRRLLSRYADRLAALLPNASQQTAWQGILSAIAGLARQGWATPGHPLETDPQTRTVLRTLVRAIDWGQYAAIELGAIEHQIEHLPNATLRGGIGRTLLEQLTRLGLASLGQDDASVAQRSVRLARALAQRLGDEHALQAELKKLCNKVSQHWFDQAQPTLSTWFVLQRSTASATNPRAGEARLTYGWRGAQQPPASPEQKALAWRALLKWARVELENPHGPAWVDLQTLLKTVESAWAQPLGQREWLALCLLEIERSASLSSLIQHLAMSPQGPLDEAMLRKLLALASDARFPSADRAAVLAQLAKCLPAYKDNTALHEDYLRTVFTRCEPAASTLVVQTYRKACPKCAGGGLIALIGLVAGLHDERQRSGLGSWQALSKTPTPDAGVDWPHWRRLCEELAQLMAEAIQRVQTLPFPAKTKQDANDLIVQVLRQLTTEPKKNDATAIDRQFELLRVLVQALPPAHRLAFLRQLEASCAEYVAKAMRPLNTESASATPGVKPPVKLLALQGAARALATRHGEPAPALPTTDRSPSATERAVRAFADVFRAVLPPPTGQRPPGEPSLKALRRAHEALPITFSASTAVDNALAGLFALYQER